MSPPTTGTLIIIDWDDTLFPTSWIKNNNIDIKKKSVQNEYIIFFSKLDMLLYKFLKTLSNNGKVVIVTNASRKWIDITSCMVPNTQNLFDKKVTVVSARDLYKTDYPNDNYKWKLKVFKTLQANYFGKKVVSQNIVSIGDAFYEYDALINLLIPTKKNQYLKTIKLLDYPTYDIIIDQINVLHDNMFDIIKKRDHIDLTFKNKNKK